MNLYQCLRYIYCVISGIFMFWPTILVCMHACMPRMLSCLPILGDDLLVRAVGPGGTSELNSDYLITAGCGSGGNIMWDYLLHNKLTGYRKHTGDLHSINQYQVRNVYTSDSHCIQEKKYRKNMFVSFLFYILHGKVQSQT